MTQRLYYNDSFLLDFTAHVLDVQELRRDGNQSSWAVKLDRTAFYPASGGQPRRTRPAPAAPPRPAPGQKPAY